LILFDTAIDPRLDCSTPLERVSDIHLDGAVPEDQVFVDNIEVPLMEAFVSPLLALVSTMAEDDRASSAHNSDHIRDDREWVGTVVQGVGRVRNIEASRSEVLE
jgi:hypothetical protein